MPTQHFVSWMSLDVIHNPCVHFKITLSSSKLHANINVSEKSKICFGFKKQTIILLLFFCKMVDSKKYETNPKMFCYYCVKIYNASIKKKY